MATWQQGINSGGFLAGIGAQNENAPKASDINATLGLIRENNELARSGANNVALTGLRGLAGVADIYKQQQQQERKAAFQKGYADAYASGDREQMRNLITAFPEEFEEVRKGMSYVDDAQRDDYGNLVLKAQVASSLGQGAFGRFMMDNEQEMRRLGIPPETIAEMQVNDPQGFQHFAGNLALFSLGHEKYFDIKDRMEGRDIERGKLAETIRSNKAGEGLQAQSIAVSRENSLRTAGGAVPASVKEYQYFNSLSPEQQKTYLRVRGRPDAGGENVVQLADGRTVTVGRKLHGAGANAFYEGIDNEGNMIRVPASSIAAPATSAANAQNYEMKKDLDAISGASIDDLGFMTGITGSSGSFALVQIFVAGHLVLRRGGYTTLHSESWAKCKIRGLQQPEIWGHLASTPKQRPIGIFRVCQSLISQVLKHCNNQCATFSNIPTITTNNITLMLVNLGGSNLNLHRYHSQQPAVTFLHYGVING